jgi:hypothetical protein
VRALVAGLVVIAISCSGNQPRGTPAGAVDHALTTAKDGEGARVAQMLAKPLRGKAVAENQLGALGYWLWMRCAQKLQLASAAFVGWDPPQVARASGGTATVTTTLHFHALGDTSDHPLPLVVDLAVEGGYWRITNAHVEPVPAWFVTAQQEAASYGADPPELVDLATAAASFRAPPPR